MPRGRSATSDHSDSSEVEAETERAKLQTQFRFMEGVRQAYSIQSQEHIRKQSQEMEKLQGEQGELQRNLGVHENVLRRQQDSENTQSMRALLEQRDELEEDLEREKQCQAELEKEISSKTLTELRRGEVNTSDRQTSQARRTQKALRTLENKLDRALICFSEQLTKTSHLREELEMLHMERVHFQQLQYRLDKGLQEIHKEMGEMISLSTVAYEARVEAQSKMTMMREKAVKDLAQYNAEMKELERVIAHERCLKEFMTTKCSERTGQDEGQDMGRRLLTELKQQKRQDSGLESVDTLEEVFQRIHTVTEEDNLDLLVTKFIQVEDRNFALFNYVNEQNNEAEAMKDQIYQTQGEMEQLQVEGLQQEQEHQALLRGIDEQQRASESQAVGYETQASGVSKTMDQIKTGVNSVFGKMECDHAVIENALGSSAGISENNIMSYLGLVEQRTNELLTMQAFLISKDIEKEYNPKDLARFLLGQNPEMPKQNITIQLPITGEDHDTEESPVTDEEERPLSQGELRQTIMKGVLRKEGSIRQAGTRDTKASKSNHQATGRQRPLEALVM